MNLSSHQQGEQHGAATPHVLPYAFGNALGNSIVGAIQNSAAEKNMQRTQRGIAQGGGDYIAEQMAASGQYSQSEIDAIRNAPETADLVNQAKAIVEVEDKYGKPFADLTDSQKAEAFRQASLVNQPPRADIQTAAELPPSGGLEFTVYGGREASVIDTVAGGLGIGANAVNKFVDVLGGPERAGLLLGTVQAGIYGIPKTAIDLAVGEAIQPGVNYVAGKISNLLAEGAFAGTGTTESVKAVSDALGGFAAEMVLGGPAGIISDSKMYAKASSRMRPIDLGAAYEMKVRDTYGAGFKKQEFVVGLNPDGSIKVGQADAAGMLDGKRVAVEAKFTDDWDDSLRNPSSPGGDRKWAVAEQQKMLQQAMNYQKGPFDRVIYHTNNQQFMQHYNDMFLRNGISNIEWVLTPGGK